MTLRTVYNKNCIKLAKSFKNPELQELAYKALSIEGPFPEYYEQVINDHRQMLFFTYATPYKLKRYLLANICDEECEAFCIKNDFKMNASLQRHQEHLLIQRNIFSFEVLIFLKRIDRKIHKNNRNKNSQNSN